MTITVDPEQAADSARRLLDERIDAVRQAAQAQRQLDQVRAEVRAAEADAEAQRDAAWGTAIKRGWSARELTRFGLEKPSQPTPRKRRAKRNTGPDLPPPAESNAGDAEQTD